MTIYDQVKRSNPAQALSEKTTPIAGDKLLLVDSEDSDLLKEVDKANLLSDTLVLGSVLTPAQLSADADDYAPTGYDAASVLRLSSDAPRTISGLVPPTDAAYLYLLQNVGSYDITLSDEDTSSSAANRFALTEDFVLEPDAECIVSYDPTADRWRLVGGGGGAVGVANPDLFSETETLLPGQWWQDPNSLTDYYPYYVKKVDLGALPNSTSKNVAHGITNYHVDSRELWGHADNGTTTLPLPYPATAEISMSMDGTNIQVVTTTDRTTYTGYAYIKYAKTTDTPVTRDAAYGNGLAGQPDLYSETETKLPGQWWQDPNSLTDYYPYYVKKVDLGALPNSASNTIAHGITNAHLDSVEVKGHADNGTISVPLPYVNQAVSTFSILLRWNDATNLFLATSQDYSTYTGYAYIKYAKTTDTPVTRDEAYGNGGAGFDDYSTSETVTNKRWLGATVYRKVISMGSGPNATTKSVAHGITGLSSFVPTGCAFMISDGSDWQLLAYNSYATDRRAFSLNTTNVLWLTSYNDTSYTGYATLEYTKS